MPLERGERDPSQVWHGILGLNTSMPAQGSALGCQVTKQAHRRCVWRSLHYKGKVCRQTAAPLLRPGPGTAPQWLRKSNTADDQSS